MSSFIIELVSNASLDVYPDNTLASFTNSLPEQIALDDDEWEVALMEIAIPLWYNNISKGCSLRYKADPTKTGYYTIDVPEGLYNSIYDVIAALEGLQRAILPKDVEHFSLQYTPFSGTIRMKLPVPGSSVHFRTEDLCSILGWNGPAWIREQDSISVYPVDIQRIHSVMVYTDIIEHSIVGHVKAPILRCFPFRQRLKNNQIEMCELMSFHTFDTLQFRNVMKKSFNNKKIELRAQTGEKIPFAGVGVTRATLMFRKKCKIQLPRLLVAIFWLIEHLD